MLISYSALSWLILNEKFSLDKIYNELHLSNYIFNERCRGVICSATLQFNNSFDYFIEELGLNDLDNINIKTSVYKSPFLYKLAKSVIKEYKSVFNNLSGWSFLDMEFLLGYGIIILIFGCCKVFTFVQSEQLPQALLANLFEQFNNAANSIACPSFPIPLSPWNNIAWGSWLLI